MKAMSLFKGRGDMKKNLIAGIVLLFTICFAVGAYASVDKAYEVAVINLQGDIQVDPKADGNWLKPWIGMKLKKESLVKTGPDSFIEIVFDSGRQLKLISVYKGEFRWNDVKVTGRKAFTEYIVEHKLIVKLIQEVKDKSQEDKVLLPPEILQYQIEDTKDEPTAGELHSSGETKNRRGRPKKSKDE